MRFKHSFASSPLHQPTQHQGQAFTRWNPRRTLGGGPYHSKASMTHRKPGPKEWICLGTNHWQTFARRSRCSALELCARTLLFSKKRPENRVLALDLGRGV